MKRKASLTLVTLLVFTLNLYSQTSSVKFAEKPFSDILAMAKSQKKLVFMDAYTVWCGPCKWMSANIFTNDSVARFYNDNFICTKFDMEKGEGLELRSRYEVKAYPTLLFIDGDGNMIHKRVGAPREIRDYIEMGKVALTPGAGLAAVSKRYNDGDADPALLQIYLERLQGAYMPVNAPLSKYMATQKDETLTSNANWKLIYSYTDDMNSREFSYLVAHKEQFIALHGFDSVDQKINEVFLRALSAQMRSRQFSEEQYSKVKQQIRATGYDGAEKVIFTADLNLYLSRGEAEKFLETVYHNIDKYYRNDHNILNSVAWQVFTMTDSVKYLQKALEWSALTLEIQDQSAYQDTYAQILFKLGRKDEAILHEKRAIELGMKEGIDIKEFEQALIKMQ